MINNRLSRSTTDFGDQRLLDQRRRSTTDFGDQRPFDQQQILKINDFWTNDGDQQQILVTKEFWTNNRFWRPKLVHVCIKFCGILRQFNKMY